MSRLGKTVALSSKPRGAGVAGDGAPRRRTWAARVACAARRALAALADLQRIVALMASHAQTQQENVNAFENRLKTLDDRRRTVTAERDRLRKQYDDFAARDRDQATSDPAARQRVADRSAVLAAMAARSRELLEGGRLVVEGRDNEVQLLFGTVRNDRALLAKP